MERFGKNPLCACAMQDRRAGYIMRRCSGLSPAPAGDRGLLEQTVITPHCWGTGEYRRVQESTGEYSRVQQSTA